MPQKTWVVGEEVLAADFNTYIQNQVVARFATTAARDAAWPAASAAAGAYSDTADTGTLWRSNGTAWLPAPRGSLGVHTLTTAFTTTGTHTTGQVEGMTKTVDDVAGRRYKFTLQVQPYAPGGANSARYALQRDGVALRVWDIQNLITAGSQATTLTHTEVIAATHPGSVYVVLFQAVTANTAVASNATATLPRQLIIEDIGSI